MGEMLKNTPQIEYTVPPHMVAARINDEGLRDPDGTHIEYFYEENVPAEQSSRLLEIFKPSESGSDQLF